MVVVAKFNDNNLLGIPGTKAVGSIGPVKDKLRRLVDLRRNAPQRKSKNVDQVLTRNCARNSLVFNSRYKRLIY